MSLLVVNSRVYGMESRNCLGLAHGISSLIQRARVADLPVAHLHQGNPEMALAMWVPIGRYDPVFASTDLAAAFPPALVEFLVRSPSKTINVAGLIARDQLKRLTSVLENTGFVARTNASVIATFDGEPVG